MRRVTLNGRVIVEGRCKAQAIVSAKPLSFLGGVDPTNGKIVEKNHDLRGEYVKNKVLCFPHGHGSTVGSYVLYSLSDKKLAPKAIINRKADPVVVVGAIMAGIPMIDLVDIDCIRTGDTVEVDAYAGIIRISRKGRTEER